MGIKPNNHLPLDAIQVNVIDGEGIGSPLLLHVLLHGFCKSYGGFELSSMKFLYNLEKVEKVEKNGLSDALLRFEALSLWKTHMANYIRLMPKNVIKHHLRSKNRRKWNWKPNNRESLPRGVAAWMASRQPRLRCPSTCGCPPWPGSMGGHCPLMACFSS